MTYIVIINSMDPNEINVGVVGRGLSHLIIAVYRLLDFDPWKQG